MSLPVTPPSLHQLLTQLTPARVSELLSLPGQVVRNERYFHWDELRHRPAPVGITNEEWWLITKFARVGQARELPLLEDKQCAPFSYVLAEPVLKALRYIDRHAGGAETQIDATARDHYIFGQLIEESITSSQLEGASTTRRVAEELLRMETIEKAIHALREYLAIKQNELQQTQQLLTGISNKLNFRQIALITGALKGRADTYTINSHQRSHGISYATARQDLMDLVALGLLQEQKQGKAFQYFAPLNLRAVIGHLNSSLN